MQNHQNSAPNSIQPATMSKPRRGYPQTGGRMASAIPNEPDSSWGKLPLSHRKLSHLRTSSFRHLYVICVTVLASIFVFIFAITQIPVYLCSHVFVRGNSSYSTKLLSPSTSSSENNTEPTLFDPISSLELWKQPEYVQNRLAVYVYDLPSRFNEDLVRASHSSPSHIRDPYCDKNFYSSEVHVHRFFLNSPVRTLNPEKANFFYVPIYTTCDLINTQPNDLGRTGRNFRSAMDIVVNEYPFWNASNGRDHVFLFSQGFSARLAGDWIFIKNSIFMVHNGEFTALEYTPHKDFTIPPELRTYFQPIWRSQHAAALTQKKRYLGQFGGQVVDGRVSDHRGSNYSHGVRQFIRNSLTSDPEYRITGVRSPTYVRDMMSSTFCLAPEGWHPWSPRPYYAIQMGCIPVIISEVQELAFEEFVDWDSFALWVRPRDIKKLDFILRNISEDELERRRTAMRNIWRVFWYEGEDGLGYQAILQALYTRKLVNRPRRRFQKNHK